MGAEVVYLRTLTPLWTGNVDRTSSQVKEAGLMGSLRWWYEGLIRGLNGFACDPSPNSHHRCKLNGKERTDQEIRAKLCAACYLFGCTGWARRFRLEVDGLNPLPLFFMSYRTVYVSDGNWLIRLYTGGRSEKSRPPKFLFDEAGTLWAERFALRIIPTRGEARSISDQLIFLLHLISRWGGLGAKTQNGFGQVQILDQLPGATIRRGRDLVVLNAEHSKSGQNDAEHFSFGRFLSTIYEIKDPAPYSGMEFIGQPPSGFDFKAHFIPCAFDIRYKSQTYNPRTRQGLNFGLRPFFRDHFGQQVANALFGETRPRGDEHRSASRIHVSHLYRESAQGPFNLKIWGWVPPNLHVKERELTAADVVRVIDEFITAKDGMFPGSHAKRFDFEKELT